ncbi:cytochrome P450 6A1 [Culex quinquefasciatus]|uniref:Cytochrome P450 6A1 n=1 Tax=Culex quinquefasciatus TaxID=7176 RepID=B0XE08_CULQU|nr:cytochrome P450 6A1 [Culex quinquefasciatus]|eukprot:XP_001867880.1 cytochrome P450 6A1 [Culex quinquefasciatus]
MLLYLVTIVTVMIYVWIKRRYSYWKDRGVPSLEVSFPAGNLQGIGHRHLGLIMQDLYGKLKGSGAKFGGIYSFLKPMVMVLDLDFAKDVLVREFQYFHDRGMYYNEKDDPLSAHLVSLEGDKWKSLRTKLTPTFTSGKMKMMFGTIEEVVDRLEGCIRVRVESGECIEIRDIISRFAMDVIGSCAFGLDCNSLVLSDPPFWKMSLKASTSTKLQSLISLFATTYRKFSNQIGICVLPNDVSDFYLGAVRDTIKFRMDNQVSRKDFMDLLIKLEDNFTFNEIAAQAFVFFQAGYETSSITMTFCLYELALNQELQERARKSVEDVLKRHGSFSYDAIQDMEFLNCCVKETLRKYPPVANLFREITKNYKVPETDITLEKGYRVVIPVYGIHHDPDIYPNPEVFNPERFIPEQSTNRHPMAYLPFGEGPRTCIGERFALMETKICLSRLLQKFRFKLAPQTSTRIELNKTGVFLSIQGDLWMKSKKTCHNLTVVTEPAAEN